MKSIRASSASFDSSKLKKLDVASRDLNSLTFKTPEKPSHATRRPFTRSQTVLSINQIPDAGKNLRKMDQKQSDLLTTSNEVMETVTAKSETNTEKLLAGSYKMLGEFFEGMLSCIRYLESKAYVTSMANIILAVESLTNRKFSYRHLAQLKYLLPEAIEVKKILVRDDRTGCLKPDLLVSLNFDVIQKDGEKAEIGNLRLRKLFRKRLVAFCKNHPQEDEVPETPIKNFDFDKKKNVSSVDGTPVKDILSPISDTPAQASRPLVRGFVTTDEESMMSPKKLTRPSSGARRQLTFDTPVKSKTPHVQRVYADDDDLYDILDEDLISSIKQKEQIVLDEKDPALSQAKWRKQMVAGLPKLFDTILFFFHSIKRSVAKKEELMDAIYSRQLETVDQREVDEQLRLLQELAPEWIYQKMSSKGDSLFGVNKISSPESIRTRLSEAN